MPTIGSRQTDCKKQQDYRRRHSQLMLIKHFQQLGQQGSAGAKNTMPTR
jgi:hypothetical protein